MDSLHKVDSTSGWVVAVPVKVNPDYLFSALHGVALAIEALDKHLSDLPLDQRVLSDVAGNKKRKLLDVHYWLLGAIESFGYGEILKSHSVVDSG